MTSRQTRAVGERFSLSVSGSFTGDYRWQCDGQIIGITNGSGNVCSVRAVRPGSGWIYCSYNVYGRPPGVVNGPVTVIDAFTERWEIEVVGEPCTVTFDQRDGSAPQKQTVYRNTALARPKDPVRPGFLLEGWYTDPACTRPYNFAALLTGDLTLYANWSVARTVTFRSRGAEAAVQTVADGGLAQPPRLPALRGFVLAGWYTDPACTAAYSFDTPVTASLTLYAKWDPLKECRASFDCADGSAPTAVTVFSGETLPRPAAPLRPGWTFRGWYADPACTRLWSFGTPVTEDTALYAGWDEDPEEPPEELEACTVRVDLRDGSAVQSRTVPKGGWMDEPARPEREGYTFDGWFSDAGCFIPWRSGYVDADLTLYAGWTLRECTVTFIEEQTWLGLPEPEVLYVKTVNYGDRVEEPPPAGGEGLFCGWVEDMTLWYWGENSGLFDFSRPVTRDITLTAVWLEPPEPQGGVLETNPDIWWELGEDGVLTLGGTGGTGNWDWVRNEEGEYEWKQPWYGSRSQILSIEVEPGIDSVGPYTFRGCDRAVRVSLPEGLTGLEEDAFMGCGALTEIRIPGSVTEAGKSAFYGCGSLRTAELPAGLTELPDRMFSGCARLRETPSLEGVTRIGSGAFEDCTGLKELDLPESLRELGVSAFAGCTGLEELVLPEGLTESGNGAFAGCTGLRRVRFPASLKSVTYQSFKNCTGLEELVLPEGVESIGAGAFQNCAGLRRIVIPAGVRSISSLAFSLGEDWEGPLDVFYGGTKEQWEAVRVYGENDALRSQARIHYNCPEIGPLFPVVFDSRGGAAVEEQLRARGELAEEPAAPEREGCAFAGWFRDPECVRPWDFDADAVTGEMTLYAAWRCRVTFSGAGSAETAFGGRVSPPRNPTRPGYRFNGWYADEAASRPYLFASAVTEDLTLYPGWLETLEGPGPEPEDLRLVEWTVEGDRTTVRFSGLPEGGAAAFAVTYEGGRVAVIAAGTVGKDAAVFSGRLRKGAKVFLLEAGSCVPLCGAFELN